MARPTDKEIALNKKIMTNRGDEKYTRIESFKDSEFLNCIIFEYFLRKEDFNKLYEKRYDLMVNNINKSIDIIHNNSSSKSQNITTFLLQDDDNTDFQKYGYSTYSIDCFLFNEISTSFNIKTIYENLTPKVIEKDLHMMAQERFNITIPIPDEGLDPSNKPYDKFTKNYKDFFTTHIYQSFYPKHNANNAPFNITVNINDSIESLMMQCKELLIEGKKKTNSSEKISIKDFIGKRDRNETYADLFYVYDNCKLKISNTMIKDNIDNYRKNKLGISLNTIRTHNKKIEQHLETNDFLKLNF